MSYLYIKMLKDALVSAQCRNPNYSMRSFAKSIDFDPSNFANIIVGKRSLPLNQVAKVVERLELDEASSKAFKRSVVRHASTIKSSRISSDLQKSIEAPSASKISNRSYDTMNQWYYSAIMTASALPNNRFESGWISKVFGITKEDAATALTELEQLGVIKKSGNGYTKVTGKITTTSNKERTSKSLKALIRQYLKLAGESLDDVPLPFRDATAMTMAIDKKSIGLAKQMIQEFRFDLCDVLESGKPDSVYQLTVNLFPVSKFDLT